MKNPINSLRKYYITDGLDLQIRQQRIDELTDFLLEARITPALEGGLADKDAEPICHHCESDNFVRYGYSNGRQRYLCKDCGRTFMMPSSRTVIKASKLPYAKWAKFIECFVDELTIKQCAKKCRISTRTAFYMRMRILAVIKKNTDEWLLNSKNPSHPAKAQMDETYVYESFKGCHQYDGFVMPRPAYKRGRRHKGKGPKRRTGITETDHLSIMCAIDDKGNPWMKVAGRGVPTKYEMREALEGHIGKNTVIATDEFDAYRYVLPEFGVDHYSYASAVPHRELNNINSMHSEFKRFLAKKKGVSSRHLELYLAEFIWRYADRDMFSSEYTKTDKVIEDLAKTPHSKELVDTHTPYPYIEWWDTPAGRAEAERLEIANKVHDANIASYQFYEGIVDEDVAWSMHARANEAINLANYPDNRDPNLIGFLKSPKDYMRRQRKHNYF